MLFRQVLGHDRDADGVTEPLFELVVMVLTPGHFLSHETAKRRGQRSIAVGQDLKFVPTNEIVVRVGLVEFLAQHSAATRPAVIRAQPLVEDPQYRTNRVVHQALANEAAAVG